MCDAPDPDPTVTVMTSTIVKMYQGKIQYCEFSFKEFDLISNKIKLLILNTNKFTMLNK